jgi:uncharacterized protein YdeI (YjbR/CyaY-like superfamily)
MAENDTPIVECKSSRVWEDWLGKNHVRSAGLWMRLAKKASGVESVSYSDALDAALCYGWIDGQKKGESENAWLQRFVPRTDKSGSSKVNRQKALALIEAGRMSSLQCSHGTRSFTRSERIKVYALAKP